MTAPNGDRRSFSSRTPNSSEGRAICNLYNVTTSQEALTRLIDGLTDRAGNLAIPISW